MGRCQLACGPGQGSCGDEVGHLAHKRPLCKGGQPRHPGRAAGAAARGCTQSPALRARALHGHKHTQDVLGIPLLYLRPHDRCAVAGLSGAMQSFRSSRAPDVGMP